MWRDRQAEVLQPRGQAVDVALHDRAEIGVDRGGGQPLELAEFRGDLVAGTQKDVRQLLFEDLTGALFMRGVHEGVEETDGHCLHPGRAQTLGGGAYCVFVQRHVDRTVVQQPFRDLEAQRAGHQGLRLFREDVIEVGALLASDFQ